MMYIVMNYRLGKYVCRVEAANISHRPALFKTEKRAGTRQEKVALRLWNIPPLTGNTLTGILTPLPVLKNMSIACYSHIFQLALGASLLSHD